MREEKKQKQKSGKKRKRIMKKALFIAAICALFMATGCEGLFADKNENSRENSQGNNGGGGEAGGKEGENGLPDDAVSGWKLTSTSNNKTNYIQEFTFKYDSKGRFCGYEEKYTNNKGETTTYKRNYNWKSDEKLVFNSLEWTLSDGRATKYYYSENNDEDRPDTWLFSYNSDGTLKSVDGYFDNYLDEEDRTTRSSWDKATNLTWSGGNISQTQELWKDNKGKSLSRNKIVYTYESVDNPFYGQVIDPVNYFTLDRLWCGIYGPTTKKLIKKASFEDKDFYEEGRSMEYFYKYDLEGILREFVVETIDGKLSLWKHTFHIYYIGIPDADPFEEIN